MNPTSGAFTMPCLSQAGLLGYTPSPQHAFQGDAAHQAQRRTWLTPKDSPGTWYTRRDYRSRWILRPFHRTVFTAHTWIALPVGELLGLLAPQSEPRTSIPGVEALAARPILAEIGTNMSRFGSDARLASWAGMCPGNNASVGKRRRGKTRKGNRSLRRVFVQCAWATRKTPTFFGRTFRRLEGRLGGQKAARAVGH